MDGSPDDVVFVWLPGVLDSEFGRLGLAPRHRASERIVDREGPSCRGSLADDTNGLPLEVWTAHEEYRGGASACQLVREQGTYGSQ